MNARDVLELIHKDVYELIDSDEEFEYFKEGLIEILEYYEKMFGLELPWKENANVR